MTGIESEIAQLRLRRRSPGLTAWLRRHRPFDRRRIRNPDERDVYWARLQQRLAESDYESLTRYRSSEPPERPERPERQESPEPPETTLIG